MKITNLCVYCGSSSGNRDIYLQDAENLGVAMVERGIGLVYGGGRVGLMGRIAETVVEKGGNVIGVIPRDLFPKEVSYFDLADLRFVDSMHERKALMIELADGFIALPGGFGTLEEIFEVLTWSQLGIHKKPCGLLNTNGYFSKMLDFLDHSVNELFIEDSCRSLLMVDDSPSRLLDQIERYTPPEINKAEWALKNLNKG